MTKITKVFSSGRRRDCRGRRGTSSRHACEGSAGSICEDLQPVRGWVLLHSRHRHLPEARRLSAECKPNTTWAAAASPSATARAEAPQGRFTRDLTNDINYRVRGVISWDIRQQTEYGTLRTYIRFGVAAHHSGRIGGGTTPTAFWDRAFIQFAGFTVGRSQSFFDLFTYGGAYSYHNVRVSGDTGASGQNLWAYTAQFGNGFSGTLSLEVDRPQPGAAVHPSSTSPSLASSRSTA